MANKNYHKELDYYFCWNPVTATNIYWREKGKFLKKIMKPE